MNVLRGLQLILSAGMREACSAGAESVASLIAGPSLGAD